MSVECPCCGQQIAKTLTKEQLRFMRFGFVQTTLLNALIEAYPNYISKLQAIDLIYPYDAPLNAATGLSVIKKKLSAKLAPTGWEIHSYHDGRTGARYCLRKV